jgi:outer membrane immunogenic protein
VDRILIIPAQTVGQIPTSLNPALKGSGGGGIGYIGSSGRKIYGTGGLAYGHEQASTSILTDTSVSSGGGCPAGNAFCSLGSASGTRTGWTLGGGAEFRMTSNWTAKAEYLYFNLTGLSYSVTSMAPFF